MVKRGGGLGTGLDRRLLPAAGEEASDCEEGDDVAAGVAPSPVRFWILFVFAVIAVLQSAAWNIYAPIQKEVKIAFGWDDEFIKWAVNSANIAFVVVLFPTSIAISKFGFRFVVIGSGIVLLISSSLRLCSYRRHPRRKRIQVCINSWNVQFWRTDDIV